jgi:hypothetical protein
MIVPARQTLRFSGAALVGCLALGGGCMYTSQFPVLTVQSERDEALDCDDLEDELLRANALRDAIMEEHGDVLARDVAGGALDVAIDPVLGAATTAATAVARRKAYRRYREAAAATEARMIHVLALRAGRACAAVATQDPARTETQILADLEVLERRLDEGMLSDREHRRARKELLDMVR